MSQLWQVIQAHLDETGVREAEFARRIGTSPTTVNSWKNRGVRNLPDRRLLEAVGDVTGVRYDDVLRAVLVDIGYTPSVSDLRIGRSHHGAWELGAELMVTLSIQAQGVMRDAWEATAFSEEDEIGDVISAAEELADSAVHLAQTAQEVAELGVGGARHLQIEIDRERSRRRAAREGRKVPAESSERRESAGTDERQSDHDLAARTGVGKTREQVEYERHTAAGEESQE